MLSGFLITGILLRCRSFQEQGIQGTGFTARRFYARRFLRIFPLYYAVLLAVLLVLSIDRATTASLWSYTYNLYAGFRGELHGRVSHFWSLAIEEQFYLIWPWIILLTPRRFLLPAIVIDARQQEHGDVWPFHGRNLASHVCQCAVLHESSL